MTRSWPRGREIVSGKASIIGNDWETTGRTVLEADLALAAPDRGDQGQRSLGARCGHVGRDDLCALLHDAAPRS